VKAINNYRVALEGVTSQQIRQNTAQEKAVSRADELAGKNQILNDRLKTQNEHLAEQESNPKTKPSTLDATRNAIERTQSQLRKASNQIATNSAKLPSASDDSDINPATGLPSGAITADQLQSGYYGGGGDGAVFKRPNVAGSMSYFPMPAAMMKPKLYDTGGVLPPGPTLVQNDTGQKRGGAQPAAAAGFDAERHRSFRSDKTET
jgi:hypothetical protein